MKRILILILTLCAILAHAQTNKRVDSMLVRKVLVMDSTNAGNLPTGTPVGKAELVVAGDSGVYVVDYNGRTRIDTSRGVQVTGDVTIRIDTAVTGPDTIKVDTTYIATRSSFGTITMWYGDGSDGSLTLTAVSDSIAGFVGKNGTDFILRRDAFFSRLQVDSGVILRGGGYRLFVSDTLILNGRIHNDGRAGTRGTDFNPPNPGGASSPPNPGQDAGYYIDMGSPSGGGNGGSGFSIPTAGGGAGTVGTNLAYLGYTAWDGGNGGAGGTSACGATGGAGGAHGISTPGFSLPADNPPCGGTRDLYTLLLNRVYCSNLATVPIRGGTNAGGGGGGGGGTDGTCLGGGGGSGGGNGGWCAVIARVITGTYGRITANGGVGGDGGTGGGNGGWLSGRGGGGGGGGGGAGGILVVISNIISDNITYSASGGAGGTGGIPGFLGGNQGSTGVSGTGGLLFKIEMLAGFQ